MNSSMETDARFVALKAVVNALVSPPEDEWLAFANLFQPHALKTGEYFIRAGERSESLGFVNAGLLRFFYQTPAGTEFNKSFAQENGFIASYSAYLTSTESRFSIQALEDSYLLVADLETVADKFNGHEHWQALGRILAEQLYIKKEQREAEFLLDDAETRYRTFQAQFPGLEDRLPQYHVASYLGITPVALSRIRKQLKS